MQNPKDNTSKEFMLDRVYELLCALYEDIKQSQGNRDLGKSSHIQGYMEACLISGLITKNTIEQVINKAHLEVFGLPYENKSNPDKEHIDWLDIPTIIRKKQCR